jgi:phage FluMu protein Com
MSSIKVSAIEDEPIETNEASNSPTTVEAPAPKPKRVRTKPQPKAEQPQAPPPPPPVEKQRKPGRMTTCTNCNKELLEKTFKYYHQLKCKPKESANKPSSNPEPRPETIRVDFDFNRRAQQKQERYTNLFTRAI